MLTNDDLQKIGDLVDEKLDKKLDEKLDNKLKPIHKKLNKLQKDLTRTISHFDLEGSTIYKKVHNHEDRIILIEEHLNIRKIDSKN